MNKFDKGIDSMIHNDNGLTLEMGITFLFDTDEALKTIIKKQLGCDYIEDKYLYIVGMNAKKFNDYYHAVLKNARN